MVLHHCKRIKTVDPKIFVRFSKGELLVKCQRKKPTPSFRIPRVHRAHIEITQTLANFDILCCSFRARMTNHRIVQPVHKKPLLL